MIIGNRLLRYLLTIKNNIQFELPDDFKLTLLASSDDIMVPIFETDGIQTIADEVDISDDREGYRLFDYEYITEEVLLKLLGKVKYIKVYLYSSARSTESEFWITEVDKNKILSYNSDFNNWEFHGMGSMCIERIGGYNMRYYSPYYNDIGTALTVRERIYCIDLPTGEDLYNYEKFIKDFNDKRNIRG